MMGTGRAASAGIRFLHLSGLVALALGLFILGASAYLFWERLSGQRALEQAGQIAGNHARLIGDRMGRIQSLLGDAVVINRAREVLDGVPGAGEELEATLNARGIPNILALQVFPRDIASLPPEAATVFDPATFDMLMEARSTGRAPVQVHFAGTEQESLAFARALPDARDPAGYLFLAVPVRLVSYLFTPVEQLDYLALVQRAADGPSQVLRSHGEAPVGQPRGRVAVSDSELEIAWHRHIEVSPIGNHGLVMAGGGGIALLLLGVFLGRLSGQMMKALSFLDIPKPPAREAAPAKIAPPAGETAAGAAGERSPAPPEETSEEWEDLTEALAEDPDIGEDRTGSTDADEPAPSVSPSADASAGGATADRDAAPPGEESDEWTELAESLMEESETREVAAADSETPQAEAEDLETPEVEAEDLETPQVESEVSEIPELEVEDLETPGVEAEDLETRAVESEGPETTQAETMGAEPERKQIVDGDIPEEPDAQADSAEPTVQATTLSADIFRAYDIRGIMGENLDTTVARELGRAIGAEARARQLSRIAIGRDGRLSGPELLVALGKALAGSGLSVVDVGAVPTPVLYYAAHELAAGSGVMVTGSHNPPEYNGFKIMLGGNTLAGEDIQLLYRRTTTQDYIDGAGRIEEARVIEEYLERIGTDIQLKRPLKVVADCGNGITGLVAPRLLTLIGAEVIPLYAEVDGSFPHHHPDPGDPANLEDLKLCVSHFNADLGVAFDGDGDRLGVVTPSGSIVWPDRLMMLLARDVLSRHSGAPVIFDVKCSSLLVREIEAAGGRPVMSRTGHSFIKSRMKEEGAPLAGEMSGHFFFAERWYGFDDGLYACARLLEILAADSRPPGEILDALPRAESTPEIKVPMQEGGPHGFIREFQALAEFDQARVSTIDGLRADFPDGWGLVRASNTTPVLVLRFEGDDRAALERIQALFRDQLLAIDPNLKLPF